MVFNILQSSEEELKIDTLPDEVQEEFRECLNIPFIKYMVSPDRLRAKDLPRDSKGRIIVDITKPHILEDMDYFRPAAIHYQKTGRYTDLKPNSNPNSAFGKWITEEVRRCWEGYIRESDGEWVTGDMYFFLNYCPISQTKMVSGSKKGNRVIDFPEVWDGIYLRLHYIEQARNGGIYDENGGNNGCEISSRSKAKSYSMASIMARYFTLGESKEINKAVKVMAMANTKEFLTNDGILTKFQSYLDFLAQNTEFPHLLLKNSLQEMAWIMGWKDTDGNRHGTMNEASGVAIKDDVGKTRGKRMNFIVGEEFGTFKNIRDIYNITLPSVIEGGISFGQIYLIGTSGENESDFQQAMEIVYNPEGYNMYALPNCWDKSGEGRKHITFFYPEYLNRKGCYDHNGNSDVTAAIIELLMNRYRIKYNTTDTNTLVRTIAERPITPQEAMLRSRGNRFPTNDLNTRLGEIDNNSRFYDDVLIGNLIFKDDKVEFVPSADLPIRIFPTEDNKVAGAIEIFELPDKTVKIPLNRYILGVDPVDCDEAATMSLFSVFVLDLWTDRIVAEYTGRQQYADDNFEIARRLALFYNGTILYESNIKGMFAYFSKMGCLHLLADTPEYLIDKQLAKAGNIGNQSKGVRAVKPINDYADELTLQWLIQPETFVEKDDNGEEHEVTKRHLFSLKNRALIQELIKYKPFGNYDRVRAFGMLMLYREKFMVQYGGEIDKREEQYTDSKANDVFFTRNFS